jgi:hypothetical protein
VAPVDAVEGEVVVAPAVVGTGAAVDVSVIE